MPGTVTSASEGRGRIRLESGPELETQVNGVGPGEHCHAVVRPEKLEIQHASEPARDGLPSVEGVVESSVYLGTSTQIVVQLPSEVSMTVLVPNASEADRARLPGGGAAVRLSWAPEHMHVVRESAATTLDTANGRRGASDVSEPATA